MSILYTPIKIKNLELSNRLVMPPMATEKSKGNKVSDKLCDYYAEKSNGGHIGLIITEHSYISPEGKASKGQVSIADDNDIEGLKKLVSVIHQNNTKVMAQINHAGEAAEREITGCDVLAPSAVKIPRSPESKPLPKEMSLADIEKVIADFTSAATRAKEAGFDGAEIHSAHGYLLNQFFSPLTNNRKDAYNGHSIEGRIKLHLEIISSIRTALGPDYPIALRLGACDFIDGGITLDDSIIAAKEFEKAGIDLLDISGGHRGYTRPKAKGQGYFSDLTEAIKKNVSIPIILTGGIVDAESAEDLLKNNKADLIGVGRAILKDSQWAKTASLKLG